MREHTPGQAFIRKSASGSLALLAFAATAGTVQAADLAIADAKIEGGKLVVSGTAAAGAKLRLDGHIGTTADGEGAFAISAAYVPSDCVVSISSGGASAEAAVANCARGLTPRGGWNKAVDYSGNDLVTHGGVTWLARHNSSGEQPGEGPDWQLFAAAAADEADSADAAEANAAAQRVPPTGPAGGDLQGNYPNPTIRNLVIERPNIATNAVVNSKIANSAVDSVKVANDTLTADDLAPNSVTASEIALGAVTSADILDNAITGADVLNQSLTSFDLAPNSVRASEIASSSIGSDEVRDESLSADDLALNSVTASEIRSNAVTSSEIATNAVGASEIAANSIDSDEVVDFRLSNQDVGVLFAEVNDDGTLAKSSGGVTSILRFTGSYEVDFGRDLTFCSAVATPGQEGDQSEPGEVSTQFFDFLNVEAVFVDTANSDGASADKPFRLVVVC